MNTGNIIAGLLFGTIGFSAFIYGRKVSSLKALAIGVLLMVYPYLVTNDIALWAVGVILTLALFILPG